jgi:hypothetical protein
MRACILSDYIILHLMSTDNTAHNYCIVCVPMREHIQCKVLNTGYTAGIRIHKSSMAIHHHNHLQTLDNSPATMHTVQAMPGFSSPNTIHQSNLTQPPTDSVLRTANSFKFFITTWSHIIFQTFSACSNPFSPFQTSGYISQIWNAFLYFPSRLVYSKFFSPPHLPAFTIAIPILSSLFFPAFTLYPTSVLCFLLLSILIRYPNNLRSLLSTTSINGTFPNINQISLFLILSLPVLCTTKLTSTPY